ncbi:MAG: hypothetical protein KKD39_09030 [Candidatus Altiarchaeota archaeon]|nr:hypothetical protein [Candidatus Altiarchaeota archaeon]
MMDILKKKLSSKKELLMLFLRLLGLYLIICSLHDLVSGVKEGTHIDVSYWYGSTYFYNLFFNQRDYSFVSWDYIPFYQHPPVVGYVYGFANGLSGGQQSSSIYPLACWWSKHKSFEAAYKNSLFFNFDKIASAGDGTTKNICKDYYIHLRNSRQITYVPVVFSITALLLMLFVFHRYLKNIDAGIIACLLFFYRAEPIYLYFLLSEPVCLFFLALVMLIQISDLKSLNSDENFRWLQYFLSGIILSLTIGLKLSTWFVLPSIICLHMFDLAVKIVHNKNPKMMFPHILARMKYILFIFFVAGFFFILLNPMLWPNPIGNMVLLIQANKEIMELQSTYLGDKISDFGHKIELILDKGIIRREEVTLNGLVFTFDRLDFLMVLLAGIINLLHQTRKDILGNRSIGAYGAFLFFIFSFFLLTGYFMHKNWNRYFIYFQFYSSFILSLGVTFIVGLIIRLGKKLASVISKINRKHIL